MLFLILIKVHFLLLLKLTFYFTVREAELSTVEKAEIFKLYRFCCSVPHTTQFLIVVQPSVAFLPHSAFSLCFKITSSPSALLMLQLHPWAIRLCRRSESLVNLQTDWQPLQCCSSLILCCFKSAMIISHCCLSSHVVWSPLSLRALSLRHC